jgi:hypothetical protein
MFSAWCSQQNQPAKTNNHQAAPTDRSPQYFCARRELAEPLHMVFESGEEITVFSVPINPIFHPDNDPTADPNPPKPQPAKSASTQSAGTLHWSKTWPKAAQNEQSPLKQQTQLPEWQTDPEPDQTTSTLDHPPAIADNLSPAELPGCAIQPQPLANTPRPSPSQP